MYSSTLKRELIVPLWKMDLSSEDIETVKNALKATYERNGLTNPTSEDKTNALICFAEWWRCEYSGGKSGKSPVTEYAGLPEVALDALYEAAKKGLALLQIKPIRSPQNYQLRFRTMLLQGGIPKNLLFGENRSRFTQFLSGLLEEVHDKAIDWDDDTLVDSLNCKFHLPESFRKEEIYTIALQIIHAVERERMDLLPFDASQNEFKRLVETLYRVKTTIERRQQNRPFSFHWDLVIRENEGELHYTLDNLKHVSDEMLAGLEEGLYQFNLEVNGKRVATYRKGKDGFVRMSMSNARFLWKGESFLDVRAVAHDFDDIAIPVANNYPPDFDRPQAFNFDGSHYVQKNTDRSTKSIVIFDDKRWAAPENQLVHSIHIWEKNLCFCEFENSIQLESKCGEEPFQAENTFTEYFALIRGINTDWMESANMNLINGKPLIEAYGKEGPVSPNDITVRYKRSREKEWSALGRRTVLPNGLLDFRIEFPDGKAEERPLYNIKGLSISFSDESDNRTRASAVCPWGTVLLHNLNGVIITPGRMSWTMCRQAEATVIPDRIVFTVKESHSPDLIITVPGRFRIFCLEDRESQQVATNKFISLSNLNRYAIIRCGAGSPNIMFRYSEESNDSNTKAKLAFSIKGHITPLGKFESAISSILDLKGHNPFNRDEGVILTIDRDDYKIRPFILDSRLEDGDIIISGYEDENPGRILACEVGDNIVNGELTVKPLVWKEQNRYSLGENDTEERVHLPFIIFSDAANPKRLVPRLIAEDDENLRIANTKEAWIHRLMDDDPTYGLAWREVSNAFAIATDYHLPYKTFNQLKAAASSPEMVCKFMLAAFFNDLQEKTLSGIHRFEQEFAIAVHWIRHTVWWEEIQKYLKTDSDYKEFFDFLQKTLALTGGFPLFIARGPSGTSGNSRFSNEEINRIRARSNYTLHNGADSPKKRLALKGCYIPSTLMQSLRDEQFTLLYSPLLVAEYLLGKRDDLWEDTTDMAETRRIISFYSREYYDVYNEILEKELR